MRDLIELNINEGGKPVRRRSPDDEELDAFQAHYGVSLPRDYTDFLKHTNGGHPQLNSFRPTGEIEDALWTVDRFYHLTPDKSDPGCLWRATEAWQSAVGKKIVPIAHDGGGNQIVLDYSSGEPTIQVCIHDEDFRMLYISDSFSGFLELLVEDPDMI